MSENLPKAVREGLEQARIADARRDCGLCIHDGAAVFRILRLLPDGFAMPAQDAPRLRGHVDLYDGARHLSRCLVVTSREEAGERIYEFKRATPVSDRAPVDYEQGAETPATRLLLLT